MRFPSLNKAKPSKEEDFVEENDDLSTLQEPMVQSQSSTTVATPPQDEVAKFEENMAYITKIFTSIGLPLVLRSEQTVILEDDISKEIIFLLEENERLKEIILKSGRHISEEDAYLLRIANFHHLIGNSKKASDIYEYILKRNPNKMAALNNKGVVLESMDEYNKALECFDEALKMVPENIHVLTNKGISLYKNQNYQQSLECLDAALKIDPNIVNALVFKAHSLYRLGKNNEALDCYNKVIRLDHNNAEALYNKACLCSMKGDKYGSITSLEKAIRLDASWKKAASHDKDLERVSSHPRFIKIVK